LTWRPDEGGSLDLTVFHDFERFITNNTGSPDGVDPNEEEYNQNTHRTRAEDYGASLVWLQTFSGMLRSLSAGADYHGVRGRDAASIYDQSGGYIRTDLGAGDQRFLGGFVQADVYPIERLEVLASLRYQDFYSYRGVDDTPGGLGPDVPSRHDSDVDPRLSLRYQLPAGFALRAAAYRAFRAPTLDNLYRSASVPGYILYSDASLKPETLNGAEAGFDYVRGPIRLQATAYDSHIFGLITYRYLTADQLPPTFTQGARLTNAGGARSRGIEAELNWRLAPTLNAVLAYTYADSVVTSNPQDPASVGKQQPGIPKNRASLGVDWTMPLGIRVSPRVRYVSHTFGDTDGVYRTDPNFIADLALSAPLAQGLSGYLQIENLFDRRYIGTNDGFTAPLYGRPFTATAGLRLKLR
jgi:outer membrane receptor protein involved in Fe transport